MSKTYSATCFSIAKTQIKLSKSIQLNCYNTSENGQKAAIKTFKKQVNIV